MKQINIKAELIKLRNHAIKEALVNLGRYKFDRFGYFAARYVVLNGLLRGTDDHMKENPFRDLVYFARKEIRERFPESWNTAAWGE